MLTDKLKKEGQKIGRKINSIKKGEKLFFVFDPDMDGYAELALFLQFFQEKLGLEGIVAEYQTIRNSERSILEEDYTLIDKFDPNYLFCLDIEASRDPHLIKRLAEEKKNLKKGRNIMVVDHHTPNKDLNKIGVNHFNPHFYLDRDIYCGAHLAYEVIKGIPNLKYKISDKEWLVLASMIDDNLAENWSEMIRKGKYSWYELKEFSKALSLVGRGRVGVEDIIVKSLLNAKSPSDIIPGKVPSAVNRIYQELNYGIRKLVEDFNRNSVKKGAVCFYFICSEDLNPDNYDILKPLTNSIYEKNYRENKDIVLVVLDQKSTGKYLMDITCFDPKIDVTDLIENAKDRNGRYIKGGGHENRAGGEMDQRFFNTFKKYVVDYVRKARRK